MKTLYQADDGKIFDNEEDCYNYENRPPVNFTSHLYTKYGEEIKLEELDDYHQIIVFMDIRTQDDLDYLKQRLYDDWGVEIPDKCGKWYYDYYRCNWYSFAEWEKEYNRIKEIFTQGQ